MKKITIDGEVYVLEKDITNLGENNTGNRNIGNWNAGDFNIGNWNIGNWNTGNKNTGDFNTGNWNTGNKNTGDWNTGDWNSGFFNTDRPTVRMFNKDTLLDRGNIDFPTYFHFTVPTTELVAEEDMTDREKEDYPSYKTTGGYLKEHDVDETLKKYRREAFEKASIEEVKQTLELPNFDYDIFEEITGISKSDFDRRLGEDIIEMNGVKYKRID